MNKYAIVKPAWAMCGDGLADMTALFVIPYHKMKYEQICGYSLGHTVTFFDNLEDAKKEFEFDNVMHSSLQRQNAIVELEMNGNKISNINKIYTAQTLMEVFKRIDEENNYFKKQYVPFWEERAVRPSDVSPEALNEINNKYQNILKAKSTNNPVTRNKINKQNKSSLNNTPVKNPTSSTVITYVNDYIKDYIKNTVRTCPSYFPKNTTNTSSNLFYKKSNNSMNDKNSSYNLSSVPRIGR